jgi:DNA-binding transcriptional ArsR family regulator
VDDVLGVLSVLKVLADPTRLRLFVALREKERCVRDLVASQDLPQPLVSHHLQVLSRAGLVQARRSDGFTFYGVDIEGMASARLAVGGLLDPATLSPLARAGGNADCCR